MVSSPFTVSCINVGIGELCICNSLTEIPVGDFCFEYTVTML